jgi:hypothetical protein
VNELDSSWAWPLRLKLGAATITQRGGLRPPEKWRVPWNRLLGSEKLMTKENKEE